MTINDLQQVASLAIKNGDCVGFRFVDHEVAVGDILENSFEWDGDEKTDDELPGTCAFATWKGMEKYAAYSHGAGRVVVIKGRFAGHGNDMADEILVADAEVIAVLEW